MKENLVLPENLFYTPDHVWLKDEGEYLLAGITDYAQGELGDAAYVDLPAIGEHLKKGGEFGTVESIKSVSPLIMPVDGEIMAGNADLENSPELLNRDCYGKGWLVKIKPDNAADCHSLLNAAAYRATLEKNGQ